MSDATHTGVAIVTTKSVTLKGRVPLRETERYWINAHSGAKYRKKDGVRTDLPRERLDLSSVEPIA